jgi:hypothetical protein
MCRCFSVDREVIMMTGMAVVSLLIGVFEVLPPERLEIAAIFYPLAVVWFVLLLVFPGNSVVPLLVTGTTTKILLVSAGAVGVARIRSLDGAWDALKVGASIAIGHALLTVIAFSVLDLGLYSDRPAFRTFALAFGGFVVPATFGAVGGVLHWQLDSW